MRLKKFPTRIPQQYFRSVFHKDSNEYLFTHQWLYFEERVVVDTYVQQYRFEYRMVKKCPRDESDVNGLSKILN